MTIGILSWSLISFSSIFSILQRKKFEESDEGLPCVNTIEKVYIGLLITVFALGVISLFRLSHFKAELQKIFDSRQGLKTNYISSAII